MNKLTIIGNVTKDPELRTTTSGVNVCSFTVAVNRRRSQNNQSNQPEADFFNVTAWRERGEVCAKYLKKGKKVAVIGSVSVRTYETQSGKHGASMEVTADEVEFLSPKEDQVKVDKQTGYQQVDPDDMPY